MRAAFPGDNIRVARLSLIDESGPRYVRMAHLACVGSHTINGVTELHSELLKQTVLRISANCGREKFCNVTNGVTPRRFVALSNPGLTQLITERIGDGWLRDLNQLRQLEPLADDPEFQQQWREAKLANKRRLAALIAERTGIVVAPESLFDVQVKRIHEYKRQHLAVLHILTLYLRLRRDPQAECARAQLHLWRQSCARLLPGKAYHQTHQCGRRNGNADPVVRDRLKVVFFPDFNVKNAHFIYPGSRLVRADLDCRQGSERHGQYEILAQRRAYHRHT